MSDYTDHHGIEPHAAEHVDTGICDYDDCDNDAEYRVELEKNGDVVGSILCCQSCSVQNRVYARENELLEYEVSQEVRDD